MADDDDDDDENAGYFDLKPVSAVPDVVGQICVQRGYNTSVLPHLQTSSASTTTSKTILKSDTNANEWAVEVERVVPSLKIIVRQDAKVSVTPTSIHSC
jgi:hypothetical protein